MSTNVTDPIPPANVVTEISSPAQPASPCPSYTRAERGPAPRRDDRRDPAQDRFGERDALVVGHQQFRATYTDLWRQVDLVARALLAGAAATSSFASPDRARALIDEVLPVAEILRRLITEAERAIADARSHIQPFAHQGGVT